MMQDAATRWARLVQFQPYDMGKFRDVIGADIEQDEREEEFVRRTMEAIHARGKQPYGSSLPKIGDADYFGDQRYDNAGVQRVACLICDYLATPQAATMDARDCPYRKMRNTQGLCTGYVTNPKIYQMMANIFNEYLAKELIKDASGAPACVFVRHVKEHFTLHDTTNFMRPINDSLMLFNMFSAHMYSSVMGRDPEGNVIFNHHALSGLLRVEARREALAIYGEQGRVHFLRQLERESAGAYAPVAPKLVASRAAFNSMGQAKSERDRGDAKSRRAK
jgi:hypothetical protein